MRIGDVPGPQITRRRRLVDFACQPRQRGQSGQFAGKGQPAGPPGPIQGLLAQPIPHQHQFTRIAPPGAEREHPQQLGEQRLGPPFGQAIGDHFTIAVPAKAAPPALQFGAQFRRVVQLAVIGQHHLAIVAGNRLGASVAKVDD
jgi:hypothetical protein